MPLADKMRTIAQQVYGATDVSFTDEAKEQLQRLTATGFGQLPVCMAKTHLSFSHDANVKGVAKDFVLPIRQVWVSAGAGFVGAMVGTVSLASKVCLPLNCDV